MAMRYSAGTPLCAAMRASASACCCHTCTPPSMRWLVRKRSRYSHQASVRSAGRCMASRMRGCGCASVSRAVSSSRLKRWRCTMVSTNCRMSSREASKAGLVAGSEKQNTVSASFSAWLQPLVMANPALRADQLAMRKQRHEDTEAGQQGHHRSATVADQRQRHAHHGQNAAHHAGVDEDVDEEGECEAGGE